MRNDIKNANALCCAIVVQAVKDYKDCVRRVKELGEKISAVKKLLTKFFRDEIRAEACRKELEELELELDKCEKMISADLVPFFEGEWCAEIGRAHV